MSGSCWLPLQGKSAKIVYLNDAGERAGNPVRILTEADLPQLIAAQLSNTTYESSLEYLTATEMKISPVHHGASHGVETTRTVLLAGPSCQRR